jgi:hypothetical protein
MQVGVELVFGVCQALVFAALAAAITALATGQGTSSLTFGGRFKAAFPAWFGALFLLKAAYLYVGMRGLPPGSVPALLIAACVGIGGWAAVRSVRAARTRSTAS